MDSETLGYIALISWLVLSGMGIGYRAAGNSWPSRPLPYLLVGCVLEIAAVWLAIREVF